MTTFIVIALVAIITFLTQPVVSLRNPAFWLYLSSVLMIANWRYFLHILEVKQDNRYYKDDRNAIILAAISAVLLVISMIGSTITHMSNATALGSLSKLTEAQLTAELPALDQEQVPLVSKKVAHTAMGRMLGEDLGLASQFEIGNPIKQALGGRLVWIAPLEPRSIFKALFGDTSPAYLVVDASDVSSARIVKTDIVYSNREWISLDTRVWLHNPTLATTDWHFEIRDDGRPMWVTPLVKRTIGMSGLVHAGVLTLDAVTAEITVYNDDVPAWIDNQRSVALITDQINLTGEYVNGWFNPSDDGRYQLAAGLDMVMADGITWYIGTLSSVARDEAITEGVLINTQTQEIARFNMQGITESTAAGALEGQNPEKRLNASNPIPFMINGIPAYVSALTDSRDVVRAYGVIAVSDAQLLAVGANLDAAVKQFSSIKNRGSAILGANVEEVEFTGVVKVIHQETSTHQYHLLIETSNGKVTATAVPYLNPEMHVTSPGDTVVFKGRQGDGSPLIFMTMFDNKEF